MLPVADDLTLALLFHANSEPWLNLAAYSDPSHGAVFKTVRGATRTIPLQPPADTPLRAIIGARRSCRAFAQTVLPLTTLADLLDAAYGARDAFERPDGRLGVFRPVPSAGGLYPLELYVVLENVDEAQPGVYHYQALYHALELLPGVPDRQILERHFLAPELFEHANVVVLMTVVFSRTTSKYGSRGYRYALLEAGHVAQNLSLVATEIGLGALCVGGFRDSSLNRALGLDPRSESVIYAAAIGHPAESLAAAGGE
jgi:SagB-type dehydrogenase family enzyme